MAINFLAGQLLTAAALDTAFSSKLDLTSSAPQTAIGPINAPNVNVSIGLQTNDLTVTGNTLFLSHGSIQVPVGNTLQRAGGVGAFRINTDSGLPEIKLPSGVWNNLQTAAAAQSPANAPSGMNSVTFGTASSTSVPLFWSPPVSGTAPFVYTVQFRLSGTTTWLTYQSDIVAVSTTVSGLLPASRYDFQVSAKNIAGVATSPTVSTNTLGFVPGGPTSVTAFNPTSTSVTISWTPVASSVPVAYVVQYSTVNVNVWQTFGLPTNGTSVTVTGLVPNTVYNFQIVAKTTGGSQESLTAQATTLVGAIASPNQVSAVTFSNVGTSSLTATWTAPTNGTTPFVYALQYQLAGGSTWNTFATTTQTSYNVNNLNSGAVYSFRVTATNSLGTSVSNPYPITMLTSAPATGSVVDLESSGPNYPIIYGPRQGQVLGQSVLDVKGVTVVDPPACFLSGTMSVAVRCGNGAVTMIDTNGNQIAGSGTANIAPYATTLSGLLSTLSSLTYTAPSTGVTASDSITITVADQAFQSSQLSIPLVIVPNVASPPSPTPVPTPVPSPSPGPSGFLVTSTGQPTDVAGTNAIYASRFTNNIGVGTRFTSGFYGPDFGANTAANIENTLNFFPGLAFIKESGMFNNANEGQFLQQIAQNTGTQVILEIASTATSTSNNFSTWVQTMANITTFANFYPGYLLGIQGVNCGAFTSNGVIVDQFSYTSAIQFQGTVFNAGRGANAFTFAPDLVIDATAPSGPADYGLLSLFPDTAPSAGYTTGSAGGYLQDRSVNANIASPNTSVMTQFGYSSFPDTASAHITGFNYVNETTQAKYLFQCLFDLVAGAQLVNASPFKCWFNLFDTPTSTLGLFTGYGGFPKKAALVLNKIMNNLTDFSPTAASFNPGKLNYTITGKPAHYAGFTYTGYKELLLQKSTGEFILIVCNEQPLNAQNTDSPISVPSVPVTIKFNEGTKLLVTVDDYLIDYSATFTTVSTLTFDLPAYPIVLTIVPW